MKFSNITHIFHIASGDLWAGAEVQMFTLASTLNKTPGIEIHAILFNHGRLELELLRAGIDVSVINESMLNGFQIMLRIGKIFLKQKPDIIHTHGLKANILASFASLFCGNIPSLRTEHGAQETKTLKLDISRRVLLFLNRICGRFIQKRIISVSQDLSSILSTFYPRKKIHLIENGVDIESIDLSLQSVINETPNNLLKVGLVGRLVPVKRVDIFIQTAKYTLENHPDHKIEFRIFGDGPLQQKLEELSNHLGTDEIVRFYGHCDEITTQLRDLDILMITSDHEGLPMVLLEAMAVQTTIIAHATGGIINTLDNGNCGRLIHDHQASAYAEALYELANDQDKRVNLAKSARARVESNYSAAANTGQYLDIYQSIIKQQNA